MAAHSMAIAPTRCRSWPPSRSSRRRHGARRPDRCLRLLRPAFVQTTTIPQGTVTLVTLAYNPNAFDGFLKTGETWRVRCRARCLAGTTVNRRAEMDSGRSHDPGRVRCVSFEATVEPIGCYGERVSRVVRSNESAFFGPCRPVSRIGSSSPVLRRACWPSVRTQLH
jgi:hypothetical protein